MTNEISETTRLKNKKSHCFFLYKFNDPNGNAVEVESLNDLVPQGLNIAGLNKIITGKWQQYHGWTFIEKSSIIRDKTPKEELKQPKRRYAVMFQDGHIEVIDNLGGLCRDHSLNYSNVIKILNNKFKSCKGFRIQRLEEGQTPGPEMFPSLKDKESTRLEKLAESLAMSFELTFPDGRTEIIHNARKFCRDNGLDYGNLMKTTNGKIKQHKGYSLKRLT